MRAHDRYAIPVSDGTDPGGWAAGLRHYVDSRYRVVASSSFSKAVRSAVTNLRKTNLPVAIAVDHGNHGWVLTGFTATADPARTTAFTVTSLRVVGPLYGLQSRSYGYDMRPDRKLTPSQFKSFFTPWHYGRVRMAWEGDWVSIQPIATHIVRGEDLHEVDVDVDSSGEDGSPRRTRHCRATSGSRSDAAADPDPDVDRRRPGHSGADGRRRRHRRRSGQWCPATAAGRLDRGTERLGMGSVGDRGTRRGRSAGPCRRASRRPRASGAICYATASSRLTCLTTQSRLTSWTSQVLPSRSWKLTNVS